MGSYLSGRRYRYDSKATAESCISLDVRRLHRAGELRPGAVATVTWTNGARIRTVATVAGVTLVFRHRPPGGDWQDVRQPVALDWTPCHYGGRRPWWLCGGCSRRVAVLYAPGALFYCRHCCRLAYTSTHEAPADRAQGQAERIRRRLGQARGGIAAPLPGKPPRMHWRTYAGLCDRARDYEATAWSVAVAYLDKAEAAMERTWQRHERSYRHAHKRETLPQP